MTGWIRFGSTRLRPGARRKKTLVEDADSGRALRAFEAATPAAVRQRLRNGSMYSPFGIEFSDPEHHLIQAAVWSTRRTAYQFEKRLPINLTQYTDRGQSAMQASLAGLQDVVVARDVWIGSEDKYFRRDEAEEMPDGGDIAHSTLYCDIGRVQLPALLLKRSVGW